MITNRIRVSDKCNNNCSYCEDLRCKSDNDRSFGEIAEDIDAIASFGHDALVLPCNSDIRKDFLEILRYSRKKGLSVHLESNGRIFSYPKFAEKASGYIDHFMMFLNGHNPSTHEFLTSGLYSQTVEGIRNITSLGKEVEIYIVITYQNIRELEKIVHEVHSLGAKSIRIVYPYNQEGRRLYPDDFEASPYIDAAIKSMDSLGIRHNKGDLYRNHLISESLDLDIRNAKLLFQATRCDGDIDVSIIIPAFNRISALKNTLESLSYQSYDQRRFEVIIVDDGSDEDCVGLLKSLDMGYNLKYYYWPRIDEQGFLSNRAGPARNVGVLNSKGSYLLFLDSDMIADRDLVSNHIKRQKEEGGSSVVMGRRVRLNVDWLDRKEEGLSKEVIEKYIESDMDKRMIWYYDQCKGNMHELDYYWRAFSSNNFSVNKDTWNKIGLFREEFVMWGGEDIDFAYRFYKKRIRMSFEESAVGYHQYHEPEFRDEKGEKEHVRMFISFMYRMYFDKEIISVFQRYIRPDRIQDIRNLRLYVTSKCDFGCKICFYHSELGKYPDLDIDTISKVSEALESLDLLILTGGEPFLRGDLHEIASLFMRKGSIPSISIPTNGFHTKRIVSQVKRILFTGPKRLFVLVSLDGTKEINDKIRSEGSFVNAMATLKELQSIDDKKLYTEIITTICKDNLNDLGSFLDMIHKTFRLKHRFQLLRDSKNTVFGLPKGSTSGFDIKDKILLIDDSDLDTVKKIIIEKDRIYGFLTKKQREKLLRSLDILESRGAGFSCSSMINDCVIDAKGDVHFCESTGTIGNIRMRSLQEIWYSKEAEEMRRNTSSCSCIDSCAILNVSLH